MGILLLIGVLCLCIGAVAAVGDVDSHAVGTDNGNLMVENEAVSDTLQSSNGDTLSAGNSWYVKAGATDGDGSEASPYGNLKAVTNNANYKENDIIYIMDGEYKGTSNTGTGIIFKENTTIKAYDDQYPIFDGENKRVIFSINQKNIVLDGLTFINGHGEYNGQYGGAVYSEGMNLVINNCTFENNRAANGGAIWAEGHYTKITDCTFKNNENSGVGGAIAIYSAFANISNNIFEGNAANSGGAINIYEYGGATIENNIFSRNRANQGASGIGGAICARAGDNIIKNNTFDRNTATMYGGAIVTINPNTKIDNCTFTNNQIFNDNSDTNWGGAIYSQGANTEIVNSKFSNNAVRDNGGAICVRANDNLIENCSFDKNWASRGGAIYIHKVVAKHDILNTTINNCTFNENGIVTEQDGEPNLGTKGGAIYSLGVDTHVTNSKFNNNVAMTGGAILYERGHNYLENNTFTGNKALRYGGGAISSARFGDTINNCTFEDNFATGYGGAVSADYPKITNSKFIGNEANHGGAICTITAEVSDSEFRDNVAKDNYVVLAATKLTESNNVRPNQEVISMNHKTYMEMDYNGSSEIAFLPNYYVYCTEEYADAPQYGVLWEDLRYVQNSISEEDVGEYLKILVFKYWNNETQHSNFQRLVNIFTDHDFRNSGDEIIENVVALYKSGYRIPTDNALRIYENGTIMVFHFREIITPSATQNVFAFNITYNPNLTVKKEVITKPVVIGKQVDFNITVKNTGESNLTSVWINETGFTKGLVYDSFKSSFNWTYNAKDKLWTLNEKLPVGKTAYIVLTFNVTESGKMQNNVSVGFSNHTFGNDTVDFRAYVPNMTIEKVSVTPEVTVGMQAYFLIKITNTGECELTNINVTEMNSDGLAYHSYVESPDWIFIGSMDHPKWQYKGILPVGESAEIMVIYNALKAGNFTNIVAIDNNQTSGSGKNDTVIHEPKLKVEKITLTTLVPVGDLTSFVIRVTNIGDCDLEGVYVKELKFDGLVFDHFTSTSGKWIFDGKDKWTYNDILFEGERSQFTVFFKTVKAGNFTNIVVAGSDLTNETPAENTTEAFENETDVNDTEESEDFEEDDTEIDENETSHADELKQSDVNLKNATGNPLLALLAVLLLAGVSRIRKFK